jgi:hypothetical protein
MPSIVQRQNEIAVEVAELRTRLDELLKRIGEPADRTISGFCRGQGISRAYYYIMPKRPRELREGKIVRITPEAEREWEREREVLEGAKTVSKTPPR